jgi:hypothetical protein
MKDAARIIDRRSLDDALSAVPYPVRVPDGEYLAFCKHVHHDRQSRSYGERVYLDFQIFEGEYVGKIIRMFLRPSVFPTSNFYRAWAVAHGGPPRSRNTRMSPQIFRGKLFRALTATVKPKHRITGHDGKIRPGPCLPEAFWYSKISCLLTLEVTNEKVVSISNQSITQEGGSAPLQPPFPVTDFSPNHKTANEFPDGGVGRRELGDGSKRGQDDFAVRESDHHNTPPPAGEGEKSSSPASSRPDVWARRSEEIWQAWMEKHSKK